MPNILLNRAHFPAGLIQPEDSYRFGLEALLLASYAQALAAKINVSRLVELGVGCGASTLAFSLAQPDSCCLGFDRESVLIEAANANAKLLGLDFCCSFIVNNLQNLTPEWNGWKSQCQIVMANPPWRIAGRKSQKPLRLSALWREPDTFSIFCNAANFFMEPAGHFVCIIQTECHDSFTTEALKANMYEQSIIRIKTAPGKKEKMSVVDFTREPTNMTTRTEIILPQYPANNWRYKDLFLKHCAWLQDNL